MIAANSPPHAIRIANTAIYNGLQFLISKYASLGEGFKGWADFESNSSGQSTSWITSHVILQVGRHLPAYMAKDFIKSIAKITRSTGAIGYSLKVPPDCDSTVHYALSSLHLGISENAIASSINFIQSHQCNSGGFSTFLCTDYLKNWKGHRYHSLIGWCSPHPCVSAMVLKLFAVIYRGHSIQFKSLLSYLNRIQNNDGSIDSYWWYSKYFATCNVMIGMHTAEQTKCDLYAKCRTFLMESWNSTGFWTNGYTETPCTLSTSLALRALLFTSTIPTEPLFRRTIEFLIGQINLDKGSWSSQPLLRIPDPSTTQLDRFSGDIRKLGVGSRVSDRNDIYTTSHVVRTLIEYTERFL